MCVCFKNKQQWMWEHIHVRTPHRSLLFIDSNHILCVYNIMLMTIMMMTIDEMMMMWRRTVRSIKTVHTILSYHHNTIIWIKPPCVCMCILSCSLPLVLRLLLYYLEVVDAKAQWFTKQLNSYHHNTIIWIKPPCVCMCILSCSLPLVLRLLLYCWFTRPFNIWR